MILLQTMFWSAIALVAQGLVAADNGLVHSGRVNQLRVAVPRVDAAVQIDGALDEPVWRQAAVLTGFSQFAPVDGRPAVHQTEVLVWYAPTAMHFGIRALAPAGEIRASLADRDRIDADDTVHILLGTYNDRRQAFVFGVNPFGVQADGAMIEGGRSSGAGGREASDLSPDYVFQSKGRLTDYGFEVEVRIPFKSLRYQPAPTQSWAINIVRKVQSAGHEDSWVPARRDATSFLAQAGTLEGLTELRRGLVLDLNPVVTAKVDGLPASDGWTYDGSRPEVGANIRWGLTTNLTLNGTVNPDFSQVEADAGQFTFDPRQALFFPEKRPFFLDGIEQFTTPNQLIYTRRVAAPLAAAKLTGKVSGTSLALLAAVDDATTSASGTDHPVFTIARVQRDIGRQSKLAFVYTDRIDGDRSNRVAGVDARLAFRQIWTAQLQAAASRTHTPASTSAAPLWQASLSRNGRRFTARYTASGIDEDFRAAAGFLSRVGVARLAATHALRADGRRGSWLEAWTGEIFAEGSWQYARFVAGQAAQDTKLHLRQNVNLRGGWRAGGALLIESFGFDDRLYADYALERRGPAGVEILPFTGTPRLPNLDYQVTLDTPQFSKFSGTVFYIWGKDENFQEWSSADIDLARLSADWRPTDQIRVGAGYQLQQFKRRTDGSTVAVRHIPRLKTEYQVTRAVFLRWVGEYDSQEQDDLRDDSRTNLPIVIRDTQTGTYARALAFRRRTFRNDWLFSYQPTPGTVIFAGYGSTQRDPDATGAPRLDRIRDGFFLKASYLFRF